MNERVYFPPATTPLEEVAEQVVGPFVPGRGTFAYPYSFGWHQSKLLAARDYVVDFVVRDGWPPEGKHLVKCGSNGNEIFDFPPYRCDITPDEARDLVRRALQEEQAGLVQRWALPRLDQLSPLLAACIHHVEARKSAEASAAKKQKLTSSIGDHLWFALGVGIVVVVVLSVICTIWSFYLWVLPDIIKRLN